MPAEGLDTAHKAWDETWATDEGRANWLQPEEEIVTAARRLYERGSRSALDIGCGVGRHAIFLAKIGFRTSAMDMSEVGLTGLREEAARAGVDVETHRASMTSLPYLDESFDYAVSYNVFSHGDGPVVKRAVKEAARVLKKGGVLQATMLSLRSTAPGKGRMVAPQTFVWDDGDQDHLHPHFFSDTNTLSEFFSDFDWITLEDRQDKNFPEYWHWHILAERRV